MFPFVFRFLLKKSNNNQIAKTSRVVIILYMFFIASLLWTSDINEGFKEIIYYGIHLNLFLLIVMLYMNAHKPFSSLLIEQYDLCIFPNSNKSFCSESNKIGESRLVATIKTLYL